MNKNNDISHVYHLIINKNGAITDEAFLSLVGLMNYAMKDIFNTLGHGDGENGGKGSLWRCAAEIYDTLIGFKKYEYGGCAWEVSKNVEEIVWHDSNDLEKM